MWTQLHFDAGREVAKTEEKKGVLYENKGTKLIFIKSCAVQAVEIGGCSYTQCTHQAPALQTYVN